MLTVGVGSVQLLLFRLDDQRYALRLDSVECVVHAVELTPVPGLPRGVRGVFSLHGQIVPVSDMRRRLRLPDKPIALTDRIIIVRTPTRLIGVLVDSDTQIVEIAARDITDADAVTVAGDAIDGIGRLNDGLVLIHNLAGLLSDGELRQLAEALDD